MEMLQKCIAEGSHRLRRRRCHGDRPRQPGRPVVVLREPRLELCHPDDFHALRDVDVPAATDFKAVLPLVFPRHSSNDVEQPSTSVFVPFSCSCAVSCCDGLYNDYLIPDDVIPLPVQYVAAQDDDDECGDADDDSVCSDANRHLSSKFLLIL